MNGDAVGWGVGCGSLVFEGGDADTRLDDAEDGASDGLGKVRKL